MYSQINYRKEIDGLRALAVIPVLLFHAGFETFGGGFIGVDVFFVISGYLITSIILKELEQDRFSLISFYERRARRILPALFAVLLSCVFMAWLRLLPTEFKDFAQSLIAVSLFSSNFLFWKESGYFETAAELKPLLHTWSLSVEEQFYLLLPLLLLWFKGRGKYWMIVTLGCVFALSFAIAQWGIYRHPEATFYLLPTRAWELLVGSFTAFFLKEVDATERFDYKTREFCSLFGLALIIFSIFSYSSSTPFPSLYTLVPTLGAALIIIFASKQTTAGILLGYRAVVAIGLLSYSLYLWHHPIFVFTRQSGYVVTDTDVALISFTITFILAYLSWKYIETPFRNKALIERKTVINLTVSGSCLFLILGFIGQNQNGDLGQLSQEQISFLSYFENEWPEKKYFNKIGLEENYREDCNFMAFQLADYQEISSELISASCYTKKNKNSKTVFIWGDSHAQQLYYGLSNALPSDYEVLQVASSNCIANYQPEKDTADYCKYSNWFTLKTIEEIKPEVVIIGQRGNHDSKNMAILANIVKGLGAKKIIFTGPSPHWIPSLPSVLVKSFPEFPERTFNGVDKGLITLDKRLMAELATSSTLDYVSLIDVFCNSDGCLTYLDSDVRASVISWDYGHLTPVASLYLAREMLVSKILKN